MACPIGTDVARAAAILASGGLVAFPTETVYGLGANALDPHAVARVFEAKGRPWFDPLIVHVAEPEQVRDLTVGFPPAADVLARHFWPGPLSLVLPKSDRVPDLVTAGLPSVAVRVPDHPLARQLLREAAVPIAAPSANPFGRISPTRAEHVAEQLGDRIDYILEGGPCRVGVESTVLQLGAGPPRLLRPGGIPVEEIEALIGPVEVTAPTDRPRDGRSAEAARSAPGMLPQHYAPRTPLLLDPLPGDIAEGERVGLLAFRSVPETRRYAAVEVLSPTGDLREAAANFFAALRRLDAQPLDLIVAHRFPEQGLGRALNDRLSRAASPPARQTSSE